MWFHLDPLDPLTEIINSGQAFSFAVSLEKFIWAMIGLFFLGAISTSISKSIRSQNFFSRKSLFNFSKGKKNRDEFSSHFSGDE